MKPIATEKCSVSVTSGDDGKTGVIFITSTPSKNVEIDGFGVYTDKIEGNVSATTNKGFAQSAPVNFSISATSEKVLVDSEKILRIDDKTSVTVNGTNPTSGATSSWLVELKITDAGQDVVEAD